VRDEMTAARNTKVGRKSVVDDDETKTSEDLTTMKTNCSKLDELAATVNLTENNQ